jgi:hypothetical protein
MCELRVDGEKTSRTTKGAKAMGPRSDIATCVVFLFFVGDNRCAHT